MLHEYIHTFILSYSCMNEQQLALRSCTFDYGCEQQLFHSFHSKENKNAREKLKGIHSLKL